MGAVEGWLDLQQAEDSLLSVGVRSAAVEVAVKNRLQTTRAGSTAAWVAGRKNGWERFTGVELVAPLFLQQNASAAMDWLEGLAPKAGFPAYVAEAAMTNWATQDITAAGEWLLQHAASPAANAYIWGYAMQAALEDPAAALTWVDQLPEVRNDVASPGQIPQVIYTKYYSPLGMDSLGKTSLRNHILSAALVINGPAVESQISIPSLRYLPAYLKSSASAEPRLIMK